MFDTAKRRVPAGSASAFVFLTGRRSPQSDIWTEAGHAIELAHREPAPIGFVVRVAIGIAVVVAAKLYAATAVVVAAKLCATGALL